MQQANSANLATSHQKPPTVTNVGEDVVADCTDYAARWRRKAREKSTASVPRGFPPNEPLRLPRASGRRKKRASYRNAQKREEAKRRTELRSAQRLSLEQKMEILATLDKKCSQNTVADKFKCAVRTVQSIKKNRAAIEGDAALAKGSRKSNRSGDFPEVSAAAAVFFFFPHAFF